MVAIGDRPDGLNINDGFGSTHLDPLREAVVAHAADLGIALDGDADRCLAVDATGTVVDGDQILAVLALAMQEAGRLPQDTAVATVMSNLGFRLAMAREGVTVVETGVGDRYVLEAMKAGGFGLGGEQSGHVIMLDHATTGDGTLTALQLMARVAATGKPLAELAAVMDRLPQVLLNVRDVDRDGRRGLRAAAGGRARRRGRARGDRPGAAAPERHRAGGAGDGRGARQGPGRRGRRSVGRGRQGRARDLTYSLRSLTRRTAWSGPFSSTRVARPRVGRMFCTRFGPLTSAQIDSAVSRAASSDSEA